MTDGHATTTRVRVWLAKRILPRGNGYGVVTPISTEQMNALLAAGYRETADEDLRIAGSNLGAYEGWPREW